MEPSGRSPLGPLAVGDPGEPVSKPGDCDIVFVRGWLVNPDPISTLSASLCFHSRTAWKFWKVLAGPRASLHPEPS